jgi:hypothetical protein
MFVISQSQMQNVLTGTLIRGAAGEGVGEIGERQLRRGAGLADGADDNVEPTLLG